MPTANKEKSYRCKSCGKRAMEVMFAFFACENPDCRNMTGDCKYLGKLPEWVEEVSDAASE